MTARVETRAVRLAPAPARQPKPLSLAYQPQGPRGGCILPTTCTSAAGAVTGTRGGGQEDATLATRCSLPPYGIRNGALLGPCLGPPGLASAYRGLRIARLAGQSHTMYVHNIIIREQFSLLAAAAPHISNPIQSNPGLSAGGTPLSKASSKNND